MKVTWGLVGNSHDASIAVWHDDTYYGNDGLQYATLTKSDCHSKQLLDKTKARYGDPDEIVWYERPFLKTIRQFRAGQGWLAKENNIKRYLSVRDCDCKSFTDLPVKLSYVQHHLSHAAYAYYTQPHDNCAVICLDSIGEFETLTVWHGRNGNLKKIHSQGYPHSLGLFYSAMTQRLGLVPQQDEYLVSKMAAQGDSMRYWKAVTEEIVNIKQDTVRPFVRMRTNLHRGCKQWKPEISTEQDLNDLAATVQEVFCYAVKVLSNWAHYKTGGVNLALAGGGALNQDAVNRISKDWQSVWVPPNPGDPGSAVGCVLAQKQKFVKNIKGIWQ